MYFNRNIRSALFGVWFVACSNLGPLEIARATWEEDVLAVLVATQNDTARIREDTFSLPYMDAEMRTYMSYLERLNQLATLTLQMNDLTAHLVNVVYPEWKILFESIELSSKTISDNTIVSRDTLISIDTKLEDQYGFSIGFNIGSIAERAHQIKNSQFEFGSMGGRSTAEILSEMDEQIRSDVMGETGSLWSKLVGSDYVGVGSYTETIRDRLNSWDRTSGIYGEHALAIQGGNDQLVNVHVESLDGLEFSDPGGGMASLPVRLVSPLPLPVEVANPIQIAEGQVVTVNGSVAVEGSGDEYYQDEINNSEIINEMGGNEWNVYLERQDDQALRHSINVVEDYDYWGSLLSVSIPEVARVTSLPISLKLENLGMENTEIYIDFQTFQPWLGSLRVLVGFTFACMIGFMSVGVVRKAIA